MHYRPSSTDEPPALLAVDIGAKDGLRVTLADRVLRAQHKGKGVDYVVSLIE